MFNYTHLIAITFSSRAETETIFPFYCKALIMFITLRTNCLQMPILKVCCFKLEKKEISGNTQKPEHLSVKENQQQSEYIRKIGHALLQYGLSHFFNIREEYPDIAYNPHGKPYLKNHKCIHYNISHSQEYILCAFSDTEVGIDIEKNGKARLNVAKRYFHAKEVMRLTETEGWIQDVLFFKYWSIKESYLKFLGTGISGGLNRFWVDFQAENLPCLYDHTDTLLPVSIRVCRIDPEYACYICSTQKTVPEIFFLKPEDLLD